jgi:membrane protease YdiL (CAAX protease family)
MKNKAIDIITGLVFLAAAVVAALAHLAEGGVVALWGTLAVLFLTLAVTSRPVATRKAA